MLSPKINPAVSAHEQECNFFTTEKLKIEYANSEIRNKKGQRKIIYTKGERKNR